MPHESYVEQTVDRDTPSPLSPLLSAKLYAKQHSNKKTTKVLISCTKLCQLSIVIFA